jgi:hypothetical protein
MTMSDIRSVVVTVAPTVMDGTVVRWYRDLPAAENDREFLSASRNGVIAGTYHLSDIPPLLMDAAQSAFRALEANRDADLRSLATHRREGGCFGPMVPISKEPRR